MRHPLRSVRRNRRTFAWLLGGTVLVGVALQLVGPRSPGIVPFEFTWTEQGARQLVEEWTSQDQLRAAFSLGLDYLFIPLYSTTIALACVGLTAHRTGGWRTAGIVCAWGAWLAAGFDALENAALFRLLLGPITDATATLSSTCATAKFVLIGVGIAFALAALVTAPRDAAPVRMAAEPLPGEGNR